MYLKSHTPNSPRFLILSFRYHLGRTIRHHLIHILPLMEPVVDDLADGDGVVGVPAERAVTAGSGAVVDQSVEG